MSKKIIYLLCIIIGSVACEKTDHPTANKRIEIIAEGTENANTRVSYEPEIGADGNITKYSFNWNSTDNISLIVNDAEGNTNNELSVIKPGKSSFFSGSVTPWSGEKDVVGVYPYRTEGYTVQDTVIDSKATILLKGVSMTNQVIIANTNNYSNGLMVAQASGAIALNESEYDIPNLQFKQAVCFIRLTITTPAGSKIKTITLNGGEGSNLVGVADINTYTSEIVNPIKTLECKASVEYSGKSNVRNNTNTFNFALFPNKEPLKYPGITLGNEDGGWCYKPLNTNGGLILKQGKIYTANVVVTVWNK